MTMMVMMLFRCLSPTPTNLSARPLPFLFISPPFKKKKKKGFIFPLSLSLQSPQLPLFSHLSLSLFIIYVSRSLGQPSSVIDLCARIGFNCHSLSVSQKELKNV